LHQPLRPGRLSDHRDCGTRYHAHRTILSVR
jgi:hypothetical protein